MKTVLVIGLLFAGNAFAGTAAMLGDCYNPVKHALHKKTARPAVDIYDCQRKATQVVCKGLAYKLNGTGAIDFVFGMQDGCKVSFYREVAR